MGVRSKSKRVQNEIRHFSDLKHIWWGAKTKAGQRRYDNKVKMLRAMCRPREWAKVLELGCGDGEFTRRLLELNAEVVATDITPEVVKRGRKILSRGSKNVRFKTEDAEHLRFPDSSFDIVCGVSILHHVDMDEVLKEAFRVLRKGGQIFFTEPNLLNPQIFFGLHIGFLRRRMEFSPDESALLRWRVVNILKKTGFRKLRVRNYDFLHPKTPSSLIQTVENLSNFLEHIPIIKEVSGSLIVWAQK